MPQVPDQGVAAQTAPDAAPPEAAAPPEHSQTDPTTGDPVGLQVAYFAFKVGGPDGKPVGLFRVADDPQAQVLTMERFDPSGEWVEDPSLIDELQEPGAYSVDEQEAQSIQQAILGAHDPAAAASGAPGAVGA